MKINVGNDIIEVERIKQLYNKYHQKFIDRVYTQNEIVYCESKGLNKYESYAARFAVKEAVFKAISSYLENKYTISWKDIEVINDESGKPYAKIQGRVFEEANIDISISHVKEYAIATAVVYSV